MSGNLPRSGVQDEESLGISIKIDPKKVLRGMFRHVFLVVFLTISGTVLGTYLSYNLMNSYTATSVLIYQEGRERPIEQAYQILHLTLPSAVEMVTLPTHLKAVKSILGLDLSIDEIEGMLEVKIPAKDSNLINIEVTSDHPQLSLDIANTLADVAVKSSENLARRQWQEAENYFVRQEQLLREELNDQIKELADFRQEHRFTGMDINSSAPLAEFNAAQKKYELADLEYRQLLVEYENLKREYEKIPQRVTVPEVETRINVQINYLETALLDARTKYAKSNPKIKVLESQLKNLKQRAETEKKAGSSQVNPIKQTLDIELIGLKAKIRSTQKLRDEMGQRVGKLEEELSDFSGKQLAFAEMLDQQKLLETQIAKNEEIQRVIGIMINIGKGDLDVYQIAERAYSNDSAFFDLLPTLGFIFGAVFGLCISGLIEISDRKYRTKNEIEGNYTIPCYATIPEINGLSIKNAKDKFLPFMRTLVERLQHRQKDATTLAVTSCSSNEGKSTITYQLANYYKRLGKKTLIVQLDWRKNDYYAATSTSAIQDYLRREAQIEDLISSDPLPVVSSSRDENMKELLKGPQFEELIRELKKRYDVVLFDTPGVLVDDYATNIAELAEATIFVVGSTQTNKDQVESSLKELEIFNVEPCCFVLNRVNPIYLDKNLTEDSNTQTLWSRIKGKA